MKTKNQKLSVITAVYFEEECIAEFLNVLTKQLRELTKKSINDWEIILIDDGSKDLTVKIIKEVAQTEKKIKLIEHSYNQGKATAITSGITHAKGDLFVMMDPDLQDPPSEIKKLLDEIEKGHDIVFGIRIEKQDSFLNKLFSKIFWWTLNKFTGLHIPVGISVMRVFNRKFANEFLKYKESNRFIEGLMVHIHKKMGTVEIEHHKRFAGKSKFNFRKKMQLAFNAIFDFSDLPLILGLRIGWNVTILSFTSAIIITIARIFFIDFQIGWPSLIIAIFLSLGIQMTFLGLLGIYIGKIYRETKQRPLFTIKEFTNFNDD